jgi:hypothetical protein
VDDQKPNRQEHPRGAKETSWRELPPTSKQLDLLRSLLGWPNHRADGMNRGQVSDLIEQLRRR